MTFTGASWLARGRQRDNTPNASWRRRFTISGGLGADAGLEPAASEVETLRSNPDELIGLKFLETPERFELSFAV